MEQPVEPKELVEILDTYYDEDPKVGDLVLLRHTFEHTSIAGLVTALKRTHPHRGYDPDNDYEIVVYQEYRIQLAGIKGWLRIGPEENWDLVAIIDDKEMYKMPADVVLKGKVDEFINEAEEEADDL